MTRTDNPRALTLADILDLRAYERERATERDRIIALKALRRVHVGTVMSMVFENRETVRFQVHEMARAEKMTTDDQIQHELDVYNKLVPRPGELSVTLFIECTTDDQMRYWFPRLVGIQHQFELRIGPPGAGQVRVPSTPEEEHEAQLTREDITSAVHYLRFEVGEALADAFEAGPVELACVHPAYQEGTQLSDDVRRVLVADLRN
jgi:hypothetical protein